MKLHDLRPAAGARRPRTRVGRGIAAGKGKTAGRGTKGQKARAGSSIPAWFEGGQTPIHVRVPKLRGFRNPFKVEYQVVNVGRLAEYAASGRFGLAGDAGETQPTGKPGAPVTVNPALLASAGLIRSDARPVKILGTGEVELALFVVADAVTQSARRKIETAGGHVQLLAEGAGESQHGAVQPAEADAPTAPSAEQPAPAADEEPEAAAPPTPRSPRRKPRAEE